MTIISSLSLKAYKTFISIMLHIALHLIGNFLAALCNAVWGLADAMDSFIHALDQDSFLWSIVFGKVESIQY